VRAAFICHTAALSLGIAAAAGSGLAVDVLKVWAALSIASAPILAAIFYVEGRA
jgi:hypothetical protein